MVARAQLSVIALAALAACAAARPDYPTKSYTVNKHRSVSSPNVNAVVTLKSTEIFFPTPASTQLDTVISEAHPNTGVSQNPTEGVTDKVKTPTTPQTDEGPEIPCSTPESKLEKLNLVPPVFRDESKPVNLRYPHAVLFGGTCGGSIIHPKWILTAGHCTLFTGGRYVLAGTNNSDDGSGVTKRVKKLHIHPWFTVGPYWLNAEDYDIKQVAARWDFLLAELEEPFELDGVKIASVPLEERTDLAPDTFVGYAGYGTEHHGGFMRSEMHAMHLKLQNNSVCQDLEQFNGKDMICAKGYEPRFDSACNGDSGSGLVDGSGKLVGVASWVQNDAIECRNGNLVVFSKVASARNWIRKIAGV